MTEYMVQVWGGAWNVDANPSIEKDTGITEGYHYFSTLEERDAFLKKLKPLEYRRQGLMINCVEGELTHKRTVLVGVLKYGDKSFDVLYDFGYEYPEDTAEYYFLHGNYSCDCNRSSLIRAMYGDNSIPDLGCGWEIELADYKFVYLD